jgi:hypothetical protein
LFRRGKGFARIRVQAGAFRITMRHNGWQGSWVRACTAGYSGPKESVKRDVFLAVGRPFHHALACAGKKPLSGIFLCLRTRLRGDVIVKRLGNRGTYEGDSRLVDGMGRHSVCGASLSRVPKLERPTHAERCCEPQGISQGGSGLRWGSLGNLNLSPINAPNHTYGYR